MRSIIVLFSILATGLQAAPLSKSTTALPRTSIDSVKVRKLYQDGDFEQAISLLESTLKEKPVFSHGDSVFIFKHLGVMYAANDNTRERGKYFMLQLLTIEPTARIMDMYASDMIYMIFKNIKEEYEVSQAKYMNAGKNLNGNRNGYTDEKGQEQTTTPIPAGEAKVGHRKGYLWAGAVVAAVGAGVALYVLTAAESPESNDFEVK